MFDCLLLVCKTSGAMDWFAIYACIRTIRIHHECEGGIETRIIEHFSSSPLNIVFYI